MSRCSLATLPNLHARDKESGNGECYASPSYHSVMITLCLLRRRPARCFECPINYRPLASLVPPDNAVDKVAHDLAANDTSSITYSTRPLDMTLAPHTRFKWPFVVVDVLQVILRMDFLNAHDALVEFWHQQIMTNPFNTLKEDSPD